MTARTPALRRGDRWMTVKISDHSQVGRYRHAVRRGYPTSACGTTALPAETWTPNTRKPRCPQCDAALTRQATL